MDEAQWTAHLPEPEGHRAARERITGNCNATKTLEQRIREEIDKAVAEEETRQRISQNRKHETMLDDSDAPIRSVSVEAVEPNEDGKDMRNQNPAKRFSRRRWSEDPYERQPYVPKTYNLHLEESGRVSRVDEQ